MYICILEGVGGQGQFQGVYYLLLVLYSRIIPGDSQEIMHGAGIYPGSAACMASTLFLILTLQIPKCSFL